VIGGWSPDNLPVMLLDRSLLTATKSRPYAVRNARIMHEDADSLLGVDETVYRFEAEANWLAELVDLPYQVSYYFPSQVRNNRVGGKGVYGAAGMTFTRLYDLLCEAFNGKRRFIEDYFLSVFREHLGDAYKAAVHGLKQRIVDEAQQRRQRKKAYLRNFDEWSSPMTKETFSALARETKADIIRSLQNGQIPLLMHSLSARTLDARRKLGIEAGSVFYATGRLIRSIRVSVILLSEGTAREAGETYKENEGVRF
jgi:hypothetical protein